MLASKPSQPVMDWAWDPLVCLPAVQLNKVQNGHEQRLGNGAFTIYSVSHASSDVAKIVAVVGQTMWEIGPDTPCSKVGAQTYMIASPTEQPSNGHHWFDKTGWKQQTTFYAITVCQGVDAESLGLLEAVLEAVAPYKESSKLVDRQTPIEAEFTMAVDAQRFLDENYSQQSGQLAYKAHAAPETQQWLPVPSHGGSFSAAPQPVALPMQAEVQAADLCGTGPQAVAASGSADAVDMATLKPQFSVKSAKLISSSSHAMATGIIAASVWGSKKILATGEASKKRLTPSQKPIQLSPSTLKRFEQTATGAGYAQKAADKVVTAMGNMAAAIASKIVRSAKGGKPMDPTTTKGQVVIASAAGFNEVYSAIEEAADVLYHSVRDSTASVVEHKYGEDAGQAAYHSMNAAGRGLDAWWSIRRVGPKALSKATAKCVVTNYVNNMVSSMHSQPGGAPSGAGVPTVGTPTM